MKKLLLLAAALIGLAAPSAHAAEGIVTNIAHLHTLLDPTTFRGADLTNIYTVEGTVTTDVNLTSGTSTLFYLQDETAGIAVFWRNANLTLRTGMVLRVTSDLDQFNGLLQFAPNSTNTAHDVSLVSSNAPMPAATPFDFAWLSDPATMERYEGSYVVVSNVVLDTTSPTFANNGETVSLTLADTGEAIELALRIDSRVPMKGQPKPTGPVTIFGVLGQFDSSSPHTSGYQVTPTMNSELVTSAPKPPSITHTNEITNLVRPGLNQTNILTQVSLQPGETITIRAAATHPENTPFTLRAADGGSLPGASWNVQSAQATFTFTPTTALAGSNVVVQLEAATAHATNTLTWQIYVPSAIEQQVIIGEFLANPASAATSPYRNPLNRAELSSSASHNEYIEVVNLSPESIDLNGWSISDSVTTRHFFYEPFLLQSSNSVILYGGPLNGFEPSLPGIATIPASEGGDAGFGLNNSGGDSIIIRNAQSNIVTRIDYTTLSSTGSMTRSPNLNGAFVPHISVSTNAFSPGAQINGDAYTVPGPANPVGVGEIAATFTANNEILLTWAAQAGQTYSVHATTDLKTPWMPIATGLTTGEFRDAVSGNNKFYRISAE